MVHEAKLAKLAIANKVPFWQVYIDRRGLCLSNDRRIMAMILRPDGTCFSQIEVNRPDDWDAIEKKLVDFAATDDCRAQWKKFLTEFPEYR